MRKASPDVDFYNVSTYQCSIFFNTWVPSTASEFRKAENNPQLSLLTEFWRNNNAHVMLTAEDDSLPTDARLSGSNLNTKNRWKHAMCNKNINHTNNCQKLNITTARAINECVLFARSIYDETQVITAAHEVSKSIVGTVDVLREC